MTKLLLVNAEDIVSMSVDLGFVVVFFKFNFI